MAAYAIFIRNSTSDPAGMEKYGQMAGPTMAGHKVQPLVVYNPCETPEGEPAEGLVVLKFDTMAEAKAWYESDAYQEAAKVRKASSDYRVILTEGL
ncbi:DUF1330 domain-containing protein [Novosphingobium sp. KCTC 2891]|uniref:DUF1330 domain-containing protein n=1 Tax=Novosphingobium sp. KCTC 2891 TaxID=2989730 RepID=UPI002221AA2C|nr:DUF1330 domain-containing protein [Novosphingobium sp. KCTC 2891]MCW1383894.1 DUF1330 domain-containing protein [Novosphingobium sp. KCTC 2891]